MSKPFDKVTPGGIYRVFGTLRDCELLTLQKCKLLGTYGWEPCRNPFNGNALEVWGEATRRERVILAKKGNG